MNFLEVKKLISRGENERVEFKRKINHPDKVIREVVAFANSEGGHLFVGVDDDGTIVGSKIALEEDFLLQKAIKELCKPAISYRVSHYPLNEKREILHYEIMPGNKKPYYALEKKNDRFGKAFVRVEDRSVQASLELIKILRLQKSQQNTHIEFGLNEKLLFNYLHTHSKLNIKTYCEITGLSKKAASEILVKMVLANVLRVIPREQGDWFEAVEEI